MRNHAARYRGIGNTHVTFLSSAFRLSLSIIKTCISQTDVRYNEWLELEQESFLPSCALALCQDDINWRLHVLGFIGAFVSRVMWPFVSKAAKDSTTAVLP